jgi:hypothetical protein
MEVNFVLNRNNANWILEKFALRTSQNLSKLGHKSTISGSPQVSADVNHFLSYNFVLNPPKKSTVLITHIDDRSKLSHIRELSLNPNIQSMICLSRYTKNFLVNQGIPQDKVSFVLPAVDSIPKLRVIRIGLSSYIYKDGRKNEKWIKQIANLISLENFEFHIFGSGWETTIQALEQAGAKVLYRKATKDFLGDHTHILESLPNMDYWMYLGFDEGSIGCVEASLAGVPLITTPQGFHLDLPGGVMHEINTFDELRLLFSDLSHKKPQKNIYDAYTWGRYTNDLLKIWGGESDFGTDMSESFASSRTSKIDYESPLVDMTFRRYISALGRHPRVQLIRSFIGKERKL